MFSETNNNLIDSSNNFIEYPVDRKLENADQSPFDSLPEEIALEIFSYLNFATLGTICLVSKDWKLLASDPSLWKKMSVYKEMAFGNDKWARYFGDDVVKDEDRDEEFASLPWNIAGILDSPCPIFPGEKIKDTHMLVRIPKTLNGGLTIKSLGTLAFKDSGMSYKNWVSMTNKLADKPIDKSGWLLMTKNVLPLSRNKSFDQQQEMITELAQKNIGYEVPETLEVVVCIFAQYFASNIHLFGSKPWTSTRCKEEVEGGYQMMVGGFDPTGLHVSPQDGQNHINIGVAALRKFL